MEYQYVAEAIARGDLEELILIWKKSYINTEGKIIRDLISGNIRELADMNDLRGVYGITNFRDLVWAADRNNLYTITIKGNYTELRERATSKYWAELLDTILFLDDKHMFGLGFL